MELRKVAMEENIKDLEQEQKKLMFMDISQLDAKKKHTLSSAMTKKSMRMRNMFMRAMGDMGGMGGFMGATQKACVAWTDSWKVWVAWAGLKCHWCLGWRPK